MYYLLINEAKRYTTFYPAKCQPNYLRSDKDTKKDFLLHEYFLEKSGKREHFSPNILQNYHFYQLLIGVER